ncbi:GTP-binding protein 10 [Echinococcus granulosus]|uniref:GTP binding protein 10 n=1 Tax=Echinococcus granulosus TaxID=6210 RepID=A0A068WQ14_ECHGR|nr:GTP-binding protein 10 [Echinococcus granulosus]CDS20595.1 GTP binding protein 10 [Echinococcus granulosus]
MSRKAGEFIDRLRIYVKSGSGSAGNPLIRGKGGNGGSVYLRSVEGQTLTGIIDKYPKRRFIANCGKPCSSRRGVCFGTNAADIEVPVPVGVSVSISNPGESARLIGDLDEPDQRLLVAQGGYGGTPVTNYLGSPGEARSIVLDLKLMADVGLIGLPNAGKSSLLQALSGAKVKIAAYPFTTLRPQIAAISFSDHRTITMTDLPGLADIAAKFDTNQQSPPPLRHTAFLKHVERTACLLVVLDALGFQANQHAPLRTPLAAAVLLVSQLQRYAFGRLLGKPMLCAINKIDLPYAQGTAEEAREVLLGNDCDAISKASGLPSVLLPRHEFRFEDVYLVSAAKRLNLTGLKEGLRHWLDLIELRRKKEDLEEAQKSFKATIESALKDHVPTTYSNV